ncbi:TPA: hypothetical protein N0F65_010530 [Lagenidium giganteum]|uniref:CHAT domain-containing protein n=1 Tax=Lagenidium giganteum TaxID=4803 RepID=A0AAV2ZDM9_9STRA|nr:TPA: hypothetical protein N0F65_010530 [Lagenidium giganteum]
MCIFRSNEISGGTWSPSCCCPGAVSDILVELTNDILRVDLGIPKLAHRLRIVNAIKALQQANAPTPTAAPPTAAAAIAAAPQQSVVAAAPSTQSQPVTPVAPSPSMIATAAAPPQQQQQQPSPPPPRDHNAIDLLVLHSAPLVIKDSKGRIYPMEKLDLETERRAIVNSLLTDVRHKAIHVRFDVATADTLRSLMTAWKCRVLHFSGHGLGQKPALCFEDGAGCTHLITPDLLRQLTFSGRANAIPNSASAQPMRLVFVNSCHSEKVASVFLNAGIPHVVAVHSDSLVVDASATMFAKHFYLSLFSGDTVRTAFEVAKAAVRALPTQKRAACCCAHLHEPNCKWVLSGSRHSGHSDQQCCCKGHLLKFPHDESSKFLLLGGSGDPEEHEVALFSDMPNGALQDYTPLCRSFIPSKHGQFIGRNTETYLMVKSLIENVVTVCLGAPGIGKSSLAISVAHFVHSRRMFPDGVYYVDLEGQKLSTVRYAVAQSIGIPPADSDEEVFAQIGMKRCLIVFDKTEELLDEDEEKCQLFLGRLTSMAPFVRLLLASRRSPNIPNVTAYSLSISELPLRTAMELLCLMAPRCSVEHATRLAKICGCLPLAIRVVGRALANARMTVTPDQMIEYLESSDRRLENMKELNQAGQKECVDRCIRSSFCHLEQPLRLAFMAMGFFRGSFDLFAANAVLSSPVQENNKKEGSSRSGPGSITSGTTSSLFPDYAYAGKSKQKVRDEDSMSVKSLGSQLSNFDDYGFDLDGMMSNDGYDLLDQESAEEIKARDVYVPSAQQALKQLHQWSLIEFDYRANRYRMHNLVQLFAEDEASRLDEDQRDKVSLDSNSSRHFMKVPASISLGKELLLTWKRRFVRYYCMIVAEASHAYRFEGNLSLFDRERANIESAMRLAHELTVQSIERVRETRYKKQAKAEVRSLYSQASSSSLMNDSDDGIVSDSGVIDALLYSNLVGRCRFIFRTRMDPRSRISAFSSCLQLSRETRVLNCRCGHRENDPSILLWDVEEMKYERDLSILEKLPSFEEPWKPVLISEGCLCIGVRELIALEALLLTDLAYSCCDVMDWTAGEYHYLEALRVHQEVLGRSDHAQVAEILNQMGICLSTRIGFLAHNIWLLKQAEKLLKGALQMRARVLGESHPEFATSLNNLANFYKNSNPHRKRPTSGQSHSNDANLDEAHAESVTESKSRGGNCATENAIITDSYIEELYRRSLRIREDALGKSHPQVAQSLNNLALFMSGRLETSNPSDGEREALRQEIESHYERALVIRRKTLGNMSFETAATLNNYGNFKRLTHDLKSAEDFFKESLKIIDRYYSDANPRAARTLINLSRVYKEQERYDEAIDVLIKARDIRQILFPNTRELGYVVGALNTLCARSLKNSHLCTLNICSEQIGKCLRLQGSEDEGKAMEEQGRHLRKNGGQVMEDGMSDSGVSISGSESTSSHVHYARVNIYDILDPEALASRRFYFPGKLLGSRGIYLKKIEAIAGAQVRYFGPWPTNAHKHDQQLEEAYVQITGASEQAIDRARDLCISHIRSVKIQWEQFTADYHGASSSQSHHHHGHHHRPGYNSRHRRDKTAPESYRGASK